MAVWSTCGHVCTWGAVGEMVQSRGDKPICALYFHVIAFWDLQPRSASALVCWMLSAVQSAMKQNSHSLRVWHLPVAVLSPAYPTPWLYCMGRSQCPPFFPFSVIFYYKNNNFFFKKGSLRVYCGTALPNHWCDGDARIFLNNSGITLQWKNSNSSFGLQGQLFLRDLWGWSLPNWGICLAFLVCIWECSGEKGKGHFWG